MSRAQILRLRLVMASMIALTIVFLIVVANAARIEPAHIETIASVDVTVEQCHTTYTTLDHEIGYHGIEVQSPYTEQELVAVARVLSGECYDDELDDKRNVVWAICNRVEDGRFGEGIVGVVTEPNQFIGYWTQGREVSESDMAIAKEVLDAYFGNEQPPHNYLYFTGGTGKTNTFSDTW